MKYLKTYQLFEAKAGLTPEQEEFLNKYTKGTWTLNPATGLVDVKGGFDCSYEKKLEDFKGVTFGKVSGDFYCQRNQLTSLEGAPQEVGGDFDCKDNNLTSLAGAPQEMGGRFWCDEFELKKVEWNLEGWLNVLEEGSPKAQKLILTILSPEELNKEIEKDPAGMIMKLKGVWNDENLKETRSKLVWPKGYEEEADLLGDLDDVGF